MVLRLLIDAVHPDETRVVIADNSRIHDFDFVTASKKQVKGNIYLAKITRVEPSLQAAFVEYGGNKQGFLPFAEIHPDYYQIPMADRKRLLEEAEAADDIEDHHSSDTEEHHSAAATPESGDVPNETFLQQPEASAIAPQEELFPTEPATLPHLHTPPATYAENPESTAIPSDNNISQQQDTLAPENTSAEPGAEPHEHVEAQEIETLSSDEDAVREAKPATFYRRYKIQEVIKRNQIVLVQVIKEERGNKGVSLTTFISLAGRYCVLMPNSPKGGGISRKIMSGDDRKRLKEISAELKTARGMSAIIRTAGIDRTRAEIKRDYEYLVKLWENIREQTLSSTAPALIYEEGDLIKRTIRDLYSSDIEEIIIEGEEGHAQARDFMKTILPASAPRVRLYQENIPLFYAYNIEDHLSSMYDPMVKLRSGGYIVINPTEALISIDVNSGRMTGERNIEETATKTNLEAVQEIARQLRLRDLAGLIVIDLIDMMDSRNRRAVERALKDALKLDRAKIQLGRISPFGLLEMSRQRLRPSIAETSSMPCPHCQGKGLIRSDASVALQVIRAMEKEAASGALSEIRLTLPPSVALHLLNARRDVLSGIEKKYAIRVTIATDITFPPSQFRLEKLKNQKRINTNPPPIGNADPVSLDMPPVEEVMVSDSEEPLEADNADTEILVPGNSSGAPRGDDDRPRRRGRRGGRGKRGGRNRLDRDDNFVEIGVPPEPAAEGAPVEGEAFNDNRPPRPERNDRPDRGESNGERGGRRRRGGRWRNNRGDRPQQDNAVATMNGETPTPASGSWQPSHERAFEPAMASASTPQHVSLPPVPQPAPSIPPLELQAPADAKPKKGWWRKIIES